MDSGSPKRSAVGFQGLHEIAVDKDGTGLSLTLSQGGKAALLLLNYDEASELAWDLRRKLRTFNRWFPSKRDVHPSTVE